MQDNLEMPKAYIKFFNKFEEINSLDTKDWKATHVLAYFCKKYKSAYNTDYKFKFNTTAPSSCFEMFIIKKLATIISSDPTILKDYIDWVFDTKVKSAKRKLTSVSFLSSEDMMSFYKVNVYNISKNSNSNEVIDRSSSLPDQVRSFFKDCSMPVQTFGDLAFAYASAVHLEADFKDALDKLSQTNFNFEILKKVR